MAYFLLFLLNLYAERRTNSLFFCDVVLIIDIARPNKDGAY